MANINRFSLVELIEAFDYLDELRESGRTNMFGAARYVQEELEHPRDDARDLVSAWMETFDGKTTPEQRAERLLEKTP